MRRILSAAISSLLLAACSGGGSDAPPPPPPTTGSLTLANASGQWIDEVYVSASTDMSWGAQRNTSSIASGTSFTQPDLSPTQWDVMAVNWGTSSDYFAYGWGLTVTAGQTTTTTATSTSFSGTLDVVNDDYYGRDMSYLYITPSWDTSWGSDWLGGTLPYAWDFELYDVNPDSYDVRCVYSDGYESIAWDVPITSFNYTTVYCGS